MTTKITEERVFDVCNLLVSQNKRVTVDAARLVIGSGSKSTLAPIVKKWREQNPKLAYDPKQFIPMPNEVWDSFQKVWTQAVMKAEEKASEEYIIVLEAEIERLKTDLMKYEKIEAELKIMKETQDKLIKALQESNERAGQMARELQELKAQKTN